MTKRYICSAHCNAPSYSGLSPQIIQSLPLRFQADFPAILTHKSGISKNLAKLMRPLFQHGIGPHRFSKVLRIANTERYDEIQLQYYVALDEARTNGQSYFIPINTEFSKFGDKTKYNGYNPTSNYISYVYSSIVKEIRPFMDQLMSFLDGIILKGDHSFKVIKHMSKVNGVSTFSCLYTLLNEFEEIRMQVLAHSKKVEHLTPQFNAMMETYRKLGMKLPELFYTDNVVADQNFLVKVIPSLLEGVVPIAPTRATLIEKNDEFSSLPQISLSTDVGVNVLNTAQEINVFCQDLIDKGSQTTKLCIGFDCEWAKCSAVSLIQISTDTTVNLIRIHTFTKDTFPENLSVVLGSSTIVKVGKNIKGDFTRLKRGYDQVCHNYIELGAFCRSKDVTQVNNLRLDVLCGRILKQRLPKSHEIRCGNWEAPILTAKQIQYAALDAWVSLRIYREVESLPLVNEKVNINTVNETFVAVYSVTSSRQIPSAYGYICDTTSLSAEEAQKIGIEDNRLKKKCLYNQCDRCYYARDVT